MDEQTFKRRTKQIALRVIRLAEALPRTRTCDILGRQVLRSGTSIGANYRAACRGRSVPDVISRLSIVEEETDETLYWIELLEDGSIVASGRVAELKAELGEILAMTVASIKTLRRKHRGAGTAIQNPKSKIQNA